MTSPFNVLDDADFDLAVDGAVFGKFLQQGQICMITNRLICRAPCFRRCRARPGEKNSGLGRFGHDWIIEEFTTDHWISVPHQSRQFPF
jgi:acyl-CoA reductase-like NAD-dependent aldehyde dehydrogenase